MIAMATTKKTSNGKKNKEKTQKDAAQALLLSALELAGEQGWHEDLLAEAADQAGVDYAKAQMFYPEGSVSLLMAMAEWADAQMVEACPPALLKKLKIRQKISILVQSRLEALAPYKAAERQVVRFLAHPKNAILAAKLLAKRVDLMWRLAGDTSTDYNYYTKRTLLAGVYTSTLLYWLQDESADYENTTAFLERRIDNVLKIGSAKKLLGGLAQSYLSRFSPRFAG
jgi:ubiquinone biosynthesis protein COQ9